MTGVGVSGKGNEQQLQPAVDSCIAAKQSFVTDLSFEILKTKYVPCSAVGQMEGAYLLCVATMHEL